MIYFINNVDGFLFACYDSNAGIKTLNDIMDNIKDKIAGLHRWLRPGLGIKRWILAIL